MKKIILLLICVLFAGTVAAQDGVSITHNLPGNVTPGETFEVEFTIAKGSIGGFAKFQMDLPFGFNATNVDSKGGNFTYENQRVKIVWVSVPGDASFSFKFKVSVPVSAVNACTVSSKFFYLENNVKKEAEMAAFTMKVYGGSSAVVSTPVETVNTPTVSSTPTETVTSTPVETVVSTPTETVTPTTYTTEPVVTNTVVSTPTVSAEPPKEVVTSNPNITTTAKTNNSSTGNIYKVQLGAFSSSPAKSKFPGVNISVVQENGLYKVLTGNFDSSEQAHKRKNELISKGYSGIVVIYQNGQRIGIEK